MRCDARFWRAHSALAATCRQTPERNHVERLERLLAAGPHEPDAELHLRHALAKELEDLGRENEAFAHLLAGNARKHAATGYRFEQDRELFDAVKRLFPDVLRDPAGAEPTDDELSRAPIFVVGMPRTGTTLVERILSSHSQVASAGESPNFGVLLKRACRTASPRVLDVATLEQSSQVDLRRAGSCLHRAHAARGHAAASIRRQDAAQFLLRGAHRTRAAGASIVVVRRNPLDTGLSNFRQLFAAGVVVLRLRSRPARHRPVLRAVRPAHRALAGHAAWPGPRNPVRGAGDRPGCRDRAAARSVPAAVGGRHACTSSAMKARSPRRARCRSGSRCTRAASTAGVATGTSFSRCSTNCWRQAFDHSIEPPQPRSARMAGRLQRAAATGPALEDRPGHLPRPAIEPRRRPAGRRALHQGGSRRRRASPQGGARRRDPRPQLHGTGAVPHGAGLPGRLARAQPTCRRNRQVGDRVLRRALHGRDGEDPQPDQDGAAADREGRLLAGGEHHGRRRPRACARPIPACRSSPTSTPTRT